MINERIKSFHRSNGISVNFPVEIQTIIVSKETRMFVNHSIERYYGFRVIPICQWYVVHWQKHCSSYTRYSPHWSM